MDGTAKIRYVALGLLMLFFGGCTKLSEEPLPDSLLPAALPEIQVPLDSSGSGSVDIADQAHLRGSYSVRFSQPRYGHIEIHPVDSTKFKYIADETFRGRDTVNYTVTKVLPVIGTSTSASGLLIFYTDNTVCYIVAHDDVHEFPSLGAFPTYDPIDVLANDELCHDSASIEVADVGSAQNPNNRFRIANNRIYYDVPQGVSWFGADSTYYKIYRHGFASSAKIKVVRRDDCDVQFRPTDDDFSYSRQMLYFSIPKFTLLMNDESCGDLDPNSLFLVADTQGTFKGRFDIDRQNPNFIRCWPDTSYAGNDLGYFMYGVRRLGQQGAANTKFAKVHVRLH